MSNVGRFIDRAPGQRGAGLVTTIPDENTANCVKPPPIRATTPEHVKKYRKTFNADPGARQKHFGTAYDPLPEEKHIYGKATYESDHVTEVIRGQDFTKFTDYSMAIREGQYASSKNEPLGTTLSRNYNLPTQVQDKNFDYGVPTPFSESAKTLLYPKDGRVQEDPDVKAMYHKSHGTTETGEQLNRKYDWKIDTTQHSFGLADAKQIDGAAMALQPERYQQDYPKTLIVKKNVEDYRNVIHEELGKTKNLGTGKVPKPVEHSYGQDQHRADDWGVGMCIGGEPSARELQPDKNLGITNRPGFRNVTKPGDEHRVFGVPSIRSDVPKKAQKSVADHTNYGDENSAVQVLFPQHINSFGCDDSEFNQPRPYAELKDLCVSSHVVDNESHFIEIFEIAAQYCGPENVCLNAILHFKN